MAKKLTQKQENFCVAYVETGNQSEAYRRSYNAENMKPETVWSRASTLLKDGKVLARVNELRAQHVKRHEVTVDSLVAELEEARQVALAAETPQTSAAVSASMGKAKLYGLDKQVVEMTADVTMRRTLEDFYGDS